MTCDREIMSSGQYSCNPHSWDGQRVLCTQLRWHAKFERLGPHHLQYLRMLNASSQKEMRTSFWLARSHTLGQPHARPRPCRNARGPQLPTFPTLGKSHKLTNALGASPVTSPGPLVGTWWAGSGYVCCEEHPPTP